MLRISMLSALLFVAGCPAATGSFCAISKPIRPSEATIAAMSDSEVSEVLAHNEKGAKLCGWKSRAAS